MHQCFFFRLNIGQVTPKNTYFHYLKKKSGSKYPKKIKQTNSSTVTHPDHLEDEGDADEEEDEFEV